MLGYSKTLFGWCNRDAAKGRLLANCSVYLYMYYINTMFCDRLVETQCLFIHVGSNVSCTETRGLELTPV